mgnify:CR=1 FL=1
MLLKLTPDEQVEFLIGPAKLYIRAHGNRIVALTQRIQKFVDGYGLPIGIAFAEIIALQHTGNRM